MTQIFLKNVSGLELNVDCWDQEEVVSTFPDIFIAEVGSVGTGNYII